MSNYDVIIIGGGHNGLVAAATLAKAGQKVLVVERRYTLGGSAATEEVWPGFKVNTGAVDAGLFHPKIIEDLDLKRFGFEFIETPINLISLQKNGAHLVLWHEIERSLTEIAKFSKKDAEKFPGFIELISKFTRILNGINFMTPPDVVNSSFTELLPWLKTSLRLKRLGKSEMMEFLRVLPMTAQQFLDEWFESDALKGALASSAVKGSMQGPQASGTSFMMLYHWLQTQNGCLQPNKFVRGGIGILSSALAKAAESYGVEIRTDAEVEVILTDDSQAHGIVLSDGIEVRSKKIVSSADPYRTFIKLVGAPNFGPQFVRKVRNIRFRGSTAKLNLALNDLPQFKGMEDNPEYLRGHILLNPSLEYLEKGYDDAKYGSFSHNPVLDIVIPTVLDSSLAPESKHIMSITMQYAPYNLRETNWAEMGDKLTDRIIEVISEYAPKLKDIILHKQMITPLDLETEYGLTEGSIYHGQMGLDQLLFMRPVAGFGQYRTPIKNLYLCGSGTHPGGGVTGIPGFNAAREVLKDK